MRSVEAGRRRDNLNGTFSCARVLDRQSGVSQIRGSELAFYHYLQLSGSLVAEATARIKPRKA